MEDVVKKMKKFSGQNNFRGNLYGYFWMSVFVIIGVIIYILDKSQSGRNAAFIMIGWGLFMFLLILPGDFSFINYYLIGKDYLICIRCWVVRKKIYFNQIADIRKIKWGELREKNTEKWIKMTLARCDKNYTKTHLNEISETMKSALRYNKFIQFCTATPSFIVYSHGRVKSNVKKIDYVLLTLKDGNQYVLSPKDTDGFIGSVKNN